MLLSFYSIYEDFGKGKPTGKQLLPTTTKAKLVMNYQVPARYGIPLLRSRCWQKSSCRGKREAVLGKDGSVPDPDLVTVSSL